MSIALKDLAHELERSDVIEKGAHALCCLLIEIRDDSLNPEAVKTATMLLSRCRPLLLDLDLVEVNDATFGKPRIKSNPTT